MKTNVLLKVDHLKKFFPIRKGVLSSLTGGKRTYVRAVDDVSFALREGEILGFVGESGCGKSTLSRTILRLTEPTGGKVYYKDTEITSLGKKDLKQYRPKMQMIFQDPFGSLNPRRTVADTLRQTIKIHNLADSKSKETSLIRRILEEVELKPHDQFWDKYPASLSGGQLQRVSIGRVLILQPSFVIADESVSMLDVSVRIGILDLLMRMRERFGISFIYITHDLVTARHTCDQIAIMYLGKIVEIGPAEEIVNHPRHPYTQALIAAVPDPDPSAELHDLPIKGYVPIIPEEIRQGCNFSPRCPYSRKECRENIPHLISVDEEHSVSCFKVQE